MKVDLSPAAVTLRLRQVSQLRSVCLTLAKSSAGLGVRRRHSANKTVKRTSRALGR